MRSVAGSSVAQVTDSTAVGPYLRYPHIVGEVLTFAADDDIWVASASGGRATRLTADRVAVARPRLSPDASQIAWLSRRDGQPEAYVMPVGGGTERRLTYWNSRSTRLLGWTEQGEVVVGGSAHEAFSSYTWAHALPVDGGPGRKLPYGALSGLAVHADGKTVLQSSIFREPATWKRYRGGTAAKLWIDPDGSGEFGPFLRDLNGQLADPLWWGDRLTFVSDHEGHGNVYSVLADGSDLRRHTDHEGVYARDLAGDGTRAVYRRAGEVFLLDSLQPGSQPQRIELELAGTRRARVPGPLPAASAVGEYSVDKTGRASAVEVRGTVQWLTHLDGPVRALADTAGVRNRMPQALGNGDTVWVTDSEGDDALALHHEGEVRVLAAGQLGRAVELAGAPDSASVAVATHDGRILVVALSDGTVRELDRNPAGDGSGLAFSPDSGWLAWSAPGQEPRRRLRLVSLASGETVDVTDDRFIDTEPTFTMDGKHLAFLSTRTFDPVYDAHNFELAFPSGTRPYLVPLALDTPSPFDPELAGRAPGDPDADKKQDADKPPAEKEAAPPVARVDVAGLSERVVPVPVGSGLYEGLRAAKGGLLWMQRAISGVIGIDRAPGDKPLRPELKRWDFQKRAVVDLLDELDDYRVSGDGTRIVVRDEDGFRVGPADRKIEHPEPGDIIEVDLDRIRLAVDPGAEWRQMTVETWRLMRDHFWVPDMAGVDWDGVLTTYLPIVDRVATRDDLSEVLWEMIGELGTSHSYERPADPKPAPERVAAFLGADLERDDDGRWVIARVLPGESSVPTARSPLTAAGAGVADGEVLLAVNGRAVPAEGPAPLLVGMAGKPVELTVERDGTRRDVVVTPIPDETGLRYQAWVSDRRRYVHERSNGRIGYVHVPDMVSTGWAEFNRDLRSEVARDGMIVDTRENNGGHTSELVIERLARKVLGWDNGRYALPGTYPSDAPRGPLVSVANEQAGSDGDIVNAAFKSLQLGPVVGTRTWGGVIGIDGRYSLVDGTAVTQPRYSFWFTSVGWGVENYGVDPDIEVQRPPQAWVAGDDPQLDAAIGVIETALAGADPIGPPDLATRPSRAPQALPDRPS
ncbi:MAG: S41 family peptidase [Jatrophihabitans sp.]